MTRTLRNATETSDPRVNIRRDFLSLPDALARGPRCFHLVNTFKPSRDWIRETRRNNRLRKRGERSRPIRNRVIGTGMRDDTPDA